VTLHEVEGPLNTYWFGVAEVATDHETFRKWIGGDPNEIFLLIRLSDGRRGHGHRLASRVEWDNEADVFNISFFGLTALSANVLQ
jgi:hypothetical protein